MTGQSAQSRTKHDVVAEFRTAEILGAARRVFAEKGFERATIDDIARTAGVAKGTVYLYYRSKQDVYWAALRDGMVELHRRTTAAVAAAPTIDAKIRAFVAAKLRFFEEHHDFISLYYSAVGSGVGRHERVQRQFEELYDAQVHLLETALQQAIRKRLVRAVRPQAVAVALFDVTRGLLSQRMRGLSRTTIDEDVEFVFDLLWKGIAYR